MLRLDHGGLEFVSIINANESSSFFEHKRSALKTHVSRSGASRARCMLAALTGSLALLLLTGAVANASQCQVIARSGKPGVGFLWAPASGSAAGYWIMLRDENSGMEWFSGSTQRNNALVPIQYGWRVRVQVKAFNRNGAESLASSWSDCVELVYDGDCDGDGIVGSTDLPCLMADFGKRSAFDCTGDFLFGPEDMPCFWRSYGKYVD